jgi:capsular polysaccharide biosynthesis protein
MNLRNVPWRAYQKYRLDGLEPLVSSSREAFFVNILAYRMAYQRLLRGRLPRMSRDDLKSERDCVVYESCPGNIPLKAEMDIQLRDAEQNTYWPGDRFVCALADATLLGPVGPGVTSDGRFVDETVSMPYNADRRIGVAVAKALVETGPRRVSRVLAGNETPDQRFDTAVAMYPSWNNYYHWTIETLPRIRSLERYAEANGEYPDLLVPADRPSWMDETIERIDYGGRVLGWSGGVAHVDRLVVPVFPDPTPEECRWLCTRMRGDDGGEGTEGGTHVFISRKDATVRRIKNTDEIQPVLEEYGFETYVLSELTIAEQVRLFSNADTVVSPHGAGLTNLVYADDTGVVELFGRKKLASFARLAHMLDQEYTPVDCEQRGVNLVVDPGRLEAAIESVQRG